MSLRAALAALLVAGVVPVGCGGDDGGDEAAVSDEELAANYEETIPPVFDGYTAAVAEGDSACEELLSPAGVEALEAESGEPCQLAVTHSTSASTADSEFELEELRPAGDGRVEASFTVDGTSEGRITFVAVDGEWRVEYEADPAVLEAQEEFERRQKKLEDQVYGGQ